MITGTITMIIIRMIMLRCPYCSWTYRHPNVKPHLLTNIPDTILLVTYQIAFKCKIIMMTSFVSNKCNYVEFNRYGRQLCVLQHLVDILKS